MSFQNSSSSILLKGTYLSADCEAPSGGVRRSTIDLDEYIANDDGELVKRYNGRFSNTCSDIRLVNNTLLVCTARASDGSEKTSSMDLSLFIENRNGDLAAQVPIPLGEVGFKMM